MITIKCRIPAKFSTNIPVGSWRDWDKSLADKVEPGFDASQFGIKDMTAEEAVQKILSSGLVVLTIENDENK